MWMAYMGEALRGSPVTGRRQPEGMVTVRIDPQTGLLARTGQPDGIFETFRADTVPTRTAGAAGAAGDGAVIGDDDGAGGLF
jgi:penicillin-binding protein 1A